jgi:hypothetical protein
MRRSLKSWKYSRALVEFVGHGTHTGDLILGDSLSLPATGRAAALPFTDRLEFSDGLIVSSELDFDIDEMKRRLLGVPVG